MDVLQKDKRSYGHVRLTMDVLLKDVNAYTVTLDELWMYGCYPEKQKRFYSHT